MTLLYGLLGVSAFAGVAVLIVATPLNHFLTKRAFKIQKGVLAARDKRMGVLNEILTGMKFIKFFAWEGKWVDRAEEARKNEIKWLIKGMLCSFLGIQHLTWPISTVEWDNVRCFMVQHPDLSLYLLILFIHHAWK